MNVKAGAYGAGFTIRGKTHKGYYFIPTKDSEKEMRREKKVETAEIDFRKIIKEAIERCSMTQRELASLCGCSVAVISKVINDPSYFLGIELFKKVVNALKLKNGDDLWKCAVRDKAQYQRDKFEGLK